EGFQRDRDLACFDGPVGLEPLGYRLLGDPAALEALAAGADEARRLHDGERVAGRLLDLIGGAGGSS
ncbi:MAG: hypothetical protein K9G59_17795, partial [Caulobacter sp.]|nr:hypothetical protein [Caulobacter sp.]